MPRIMLGAMLSFGVWAIGCAPADRPALVSARPAFPVHWWQPVPESDAASWEVLPQAAGPGEVILSKRNELGLLSNFAETPFEFHGRRYRSLEGFWQMMKYPEDSADPRATAPGVVWAHTRDEVAQMVGFEAKHAGDLGSANMRAMGINWVTFEGKRLIYHTPERGEHYDLILAATWAKVRQNVNVRNVLLSTGDLTLLPDHHQAPDAPPAWRYYEILTGIRNALREEATPRAR